MASLKNLGRASAIPFHDTWRQQPNKTTQPNAAARFAQPHEATNLVQSGAPSNPHQSELTLAVMTRATRNAPIGDGQHIRTYAPWVAF